MNKILRPRRFLTSVLLFFFSVLFIFSASVQLQANGVTVTGTNSAFNTELSNAFGGPQFANDFVRLFLDPEAENIARTNVIGGLMAHPTSDATIKSGATPGFMVGACGTMAVGLSNKVDVQSGTGTTEYPMVAGVVGFNAYGGINLSLWGIGFPNLDVIVHQGGGSFSKKYDDYTISGSSYRGGVLLRYHVINPISLVVVKFLGLSIGTGYAFQRVNFEFAREDTETISVGGFTNATWRSKQTIGFTANSNIFPLQVQTGIQVLFFLNLHAGAGYALAFGETEVGYKNVGTVTHTTDSATMTIDYTGKSGGQNTAYVFGGGEINIFLVHLVVEVMSDLDNIWGVSGGLRFQW